MSQFHSLTIKQVRNETRDAVSIAFDVPPHLQDAFRFTQGQYLVMRTQLGNEEVRRSYSICSAVQDGELRVAVKRVAGGRFSAFANDTLKAGQQLEVMPPAGSFFVPLQPTRQGNYLGVAAGSGITPILSIIATTLASEPHSRFTLLYGNRASAGALFRNTLEDLKNRYLDRLNLISCSAASSRTSTCTTAASTPTSAASCSPAGWTWPASMLRSSAARRP